MQQNISKKAEISSAGSESFAEGQIDDKQYLSEEQQTNGVGGKDADNEQPSLSKTNMLTTICTPISSCASKRKKRDHDDSYDFLMKHRISFSMVQQQQTRDEHGADRQMMIQIVTMTMMQMQMMHANGATQNEASNEILNVMMENLASQTMNAQPSLGLAAGSEQSGEKDNKNTTYLP